MIAESGRILYVCGQVRIVTSRRLGDPAAYWRHRFFILCAVVATLAVLAWQFTRARPAPAAPQVRDVLPGAAYGSPWVSPGPAPLRWPARGFMLLP